MLEKAPSGIQTHEIAIADPNLSKPNILAMKSLNKIINPQSIIDRTKFVMKATFVLL